MTVTIAAELGLNHNGNLETALRLVEIAAECECDAVKVQAIQPQDFLPEGHDLWDVTEQCWLGWDGYTDLCVKAHSCGLRFGGTPSSVAGVNRLREIGADYLKVSSDYLLRRDIIKACARTGLPTVLSTGMSTLAEVRTAIRAYKSAGGRHLTCLVCTSSYPCPDRDANLLRISNDFWRLEGVKVGYSDHTLGHVAATAAVALGATMIEKHFTLHTKQSGPDHRFSANTWVMRELVINVRRVENMLGGLGIRPTPSEEAVRDKWRILEGTVRAA